MMAVRTFGLLAVAAFLIFPVFAARAADTQLSGGELLARCQGTPEMLKADTLYCKGYLEGIEDLVANSKAHGGSPPFCVPPDGVTDVQLRDTYMSWAKDHAGELAQPALNAAMAALRAAYPCAK
jgi:hypothetical protein